MKLIGEMLSSERRGRTLFTRLTFQVAPGEALVVVGPNGAGKTTLLRIITGLLKPDRGSIRLQGGQADRTVGEHCHYVGHPNAIKNALTILENMIFWSRFLGGARERIGLALEAFGLMSLRDVPAGYLSAGQRRRLALSRLLLADRPIWLLDEPTASLDADAQALVAKITNARLAAGGLVIATTHAQLGLTPSRELPLGSRA
jgi:heme exporter protein A